MTTREFLARLDAVRPVSGGWVARCPSHEDRNPSLSVREGRDGRILLRCHAGCNFRDIVSALGLKPRDLMGDAERSDAQFQPGQSGNPGGSEKHERIVATYDYTDEDGTLLYQKVRYEPKRFVQRRPNPAGGWTYSLRGTRSVLFRLPAVAQAVRLGHAVWLVEGEKDAETLSRAGLCGTTGGAAGVWCDEFTQTLRGANIVLIPDADEAGRAHARKVCEAIHRVVASLRVIEVPRGKDVTEYLESGGSISDLVALAEAAPEWKKSEPPSTVRQNSVELAEDATADDGDVPGVFLLPSDRTPISESARGIFRVIANTSTMFVQAGSVVELAQDGSGRPYLKPLRAEELCSRLERYGRRLMAWRVGRDGGPVLAERRCPEDTAKKLLASKEAQEILPPITLVSKCSVMLEVDGEVRVASRGYTRAAGGILVTGGDVPPDMPVDRARELLHGLLEDFDFMGPGDRARALAAIVTPALRMGRLLRGFAPIFVVEADQSQAGKGYLGRLIRAIFSDSGYVVTMKDGGVGGLAESIGQAILSGSAFIELDNIRGRVDSQALESVLTNDGGVPCRVPHRAEVRVDASHITWSLTSNGAEATRDLANRSCIIRIRKRPKDYQFRAYPEGDVLRHVEANQNLYLGAVLTICRAWIESGRPRTREHRHDFREWTQSIDWVSRELLGAGPLMDGHEAAQERVASPHLGWLRSVALAITQGGRELGGWTASRILDLCEEEGIEVPVGRGAADEKSVGRALAKCFIDSDEVVIDDLVVTRRCFAEYDRENRKERERKEYDFRLRPVRPVRPDPIISRESLQIFQELPAQGAWGAQGAGPAGPPGDSPPETPSADYAEFEGLISQKSPVSPPHGSFQECGVPNSANSADTPGDPDEPEPELMPFECLPPLMHNPPL